MARRLSAKPLPPVSVGEGATGVPVVSLATQEVNGKTIAVLTSHVHVRGAQPKHIQTVLEQPAAGTLGRWLRAFDRGSHTALPELISLGGIMEEYGASRRTVQRWRNAADFPRAVPVTGGGPVWEASTVREWATQHRKRRADRSHIASPASA